MNSMARLSDLPRTDGEEPRTLPTLTTEDQAESLLAKLRWPQGPICPFCLRNDTYRLNLKTVNRRRYKCRLCRRQFSVTKGTILEGSKLSLASWVRLVQILCEPNAEWSVSDVARELNVGYDTVRNALDRLSYAARREPLATMIDEAGDA